METFKQWMQNQYDYEELYTITEQGCSSGCAGGLIYYEETNNLYDRFADELHDKLSEFIYSTGEAPDFIIKNIGNLTSFKNAMVWFIAEVYALELTESEEQNV